MEGLVSKNTVKNWLENYKSFIAEDRAPDAIGVNSGPKAYDGINDGKLNKIMLDQAFKEMPQLLHTCAVVRWLQPVSLGEALKIVGKPKTTYYRLCDKVIYYIYYHVNGKMAYLKDLVEKVKKDA